MIRVLGGHFHTGQYKPAQAVHAGHQSRGVGVVGRIQVQHITAGEIHRLADSRCCQPVAAGQVGNELSAQITHLRGAEHHVFEPQFLEKLLGCAIALKQPAADENQHVPADAAAARDNAQQLLGDKDTVARPAAKHALAGDKGPVEAEDFLSPGLLHLQLSATAACRHPGVEADLWRLGKQRTGKRLFAEPVDTGTQDAEGLGLAVYVVFFKPCRWNNA
ncbi:MAG: hypothetical protein WCD46_15675 [Desulfobacterales bacterium]